MSRNSLRLTPLALALGIAAASSVSAQAVLDQSFDGGWLGQNSNRKGINLDYLGTANPPQLFYTYFTYDQQGNPLWLTSNFPVDETTSSYEHDVVMVTGGRFDTDGTPANTVVGTGVFNAISCNEVSLSFTPANGSNLPATTQTFTRFEPAPDTCQDGGGECPAGTTDNGDGTCDLPNSITGSLTLNAGKTYIVEGQVSVEAGGVLNVNPGVTVRGSTNTASPNFIAVKADGQINAVGTAAAPITFTGPSDAPGSWAGLVIAGRSTCNDAAGDLACNFEAVPEITFGGDELDDNSGTLQYVRILWAGQVIGEDEELNSLTLLGVGSGTTIDHVQVHGGLDDGFEMFGGSVDLKNVVASDVGDDGFDFDTGYTGRIQYALMYQGDNPDTGTDSNGVESDNDGDNPNLTPRTRPTISNLTIVGGATGNEGMRIRRGSGGIYHNTVITGFVDRCLNLNGPDTQGLSEADLAFNHSFIGECTGGEFEDAATETRFNDGDSNNTGDPMLDGYMPAAGSPLLGTGMVPSDPFFTTADYIGAFDGSNDWTAGWTVPFAE